MRSSRDKLQYRSTVVTALGALAINIDVKLALRTSQLVWTHPANRGRRMRALLRAIAWQVRKRLSGTPTEVRLVSGVKIRCYADSHDASNIIYFNGLPNPSEMLFLKHYLKLGDKVIDAGANIGVYTLLMAELVGPAGTVLSFEPDRKCAARLRENVALNKFNNVIIREAALADFKGMAEFSVEEDTAGAFANLRKVDLTRSVEVTRLDEEMADAQFAVCKMDIEGAEPAALMATPLERKNPPVLLLELTRKTLRRSGTSMEDMLRLLDRHGYALWSYNPETRKLDEWQERPRKPGHVGDAIAIADEHLGHVLQRIRATHPTEPIRRTSNVEGVNDRPPRERISE